MLNFTDPPVRNKRHHYPWKDILAELKNNPGEWACLNPEHKATISTYNAVSQGKVKTFLPEMGIEICTRNNNYKVQPRTCDIFVKYRPDLDKSLTVKEQEQAMRDMRKRQKEKENMTVSTVESQAD